MIEKNNDDLSNVDMLALDQGGIEWIKYSADIDLKVLNDFEKVHSGGSSDSCILRSKSNPQMHMGVKCV